jgi:hypothetical protein
MKLFRHVGLLVLLAAGLVVVAVPSIGIAAGDLPWQTGIRAVGNGATIEPAVNDITGAQTFLITPNHAPFYQAGVTPGPLPPSFAHASAPLYLVTYPIGSTADASAPLNCYTAGYFDHGSSSYNCDHAQIPGVLGHDHLVGVPGSQKAGGDYNVQWHVFVTFFTGQGQTDKAMNNRILTLQQLQAEQTAGDVTPFVDSGIYFNCSAVSGAVYRNGTPLSFTPHP